MKIDFLLPAVAGLQVTGIAYQEKHVILSLTTTHPTAHCPVCGDHSKKIHSRYQRRVADLPWSDKQVQLQLTVRRFFCEQEECKRKVFSERLHPAIAAYARRTARLDHHLQTLALLLGGERAALLCQLLNTGSVSGDTLLKLTRSVHIDTPATPTVLGIDEWAKYRHSLTKEQTQYLAKRWQEGNTKPRQIWRELKEQGYKGVASCIYRAITLLPARVVAPTLTPTILDQKAATRAQRPLSARSAVWLLIRPKEELSQKSQQLLSILLQKHEQAKQAYPLAQ